MKNENIIVAGTQLQKSDETIFELLMSKSNY
jgi:hypothetical protein